ncbi:MULTISPECIES: hypothetical protein [Pseudoalteromonas]|uniref:Uncharacterized protein n=1 Tax=Pseudoalteromonas amylolytica TaxID=1859457 RepID=A0A1S1MVV9_9GAMM|nr:MULTISPECIES: hypothetical protein [Pseudoalteromonas]OHU85500.1 hypothetical protein BFC16_19320 [Pseudoalteromonas sp. JW3]OHU91734.1 hypothetical protein BET10_08015 [Pseudoalteromonas amylolytica]
MCTINEFNKFAINPNRVPYTENVGSRPPSAKDVKRCRKRWQLEDELDRRAIDKAYSLDGLLDDD